MTLVLQNVHANIERHGQPGSRFISQLSASGLKHVLAHTLAVSVVLLAIILSGRFVQYPAEAASGKLAADILLPVMLYRLPGFLELLIPLGLFIGIFMAYGRLYVESEVLILGACGAGRWRSRA